MDLTIVIPTYNRNNNVIECVLALEHKALRISSLSMMDPASRLWFSPANSARVIRHDRHRGRSAAINTGLKAAVYDIVLIMEDDI